MMRRLWQQLAIGTNWPVLAAVGILSTLGAFSVWFHPRADGVKQLVFLGVAAGCMIVFQAVNYQQIGRWAWLFYIAGLLLVLYTVAAATIGGRNPLPLVYRVNGAYAWLNFGIVSLQPAELMKIAFILVLARYLRFRSNYRTLRGLLPPFALVLVPIALILKQPDLGTALTFIPALFVMLFVAGARLLHLAAIVSMGLAIFPVLWLSGQHMVKDPSDDQATIVCGSCPSVPALNRLPQFVKHYQRERVYALFIDDERTRREKGFQQELALTAFGSGGITGKGMGEIPVGVYVPEAHNDMVLSLIGEQFGLLGALAIIGAYLVLFTAGIEIASRTKEPFGRLVAVGTVALLAGQAFINLMVCLRLLPVTGVTLPFVSYGGSSLVASFMAAGLLLNIGQNRPLVIAPESFEYSTER